MPQYDFSPLFERYPAIISQMPDKFDSHDFILRLAQENQKLYIEALYHYRNSSEPEASFMVVHGILARHLNEYPVLVKQIGTALHQINLFSGMLTHGQSDFFVNYIDPLSHTVRKYFPDFLVQYKVGNLTIDRNQNRLHD